MKKYIIIRFKIVIWLDILIYKVAKPSKNLIKTLNAIEYIELDIQIIKAPRTDDPII